MVYIIAEIGINHNGSLKLAYSLIDAAVVAHVDAVKFQKRDLFESFTLTQLNETYDTPNSWGQTYGLHKQHLEFSEDEMVQLHQYANERGIDFICTGCDRASVDFLNTLEMPYFKCASGDLTNIPLLTYIAQQQKPFILSTGMSSMDTIRHVVQTLEPINPHFAILSCTSTYPTPADDIHLSTIDLFKREFPEHMIGYSGHEMGYIPTLGAVAKGACIIERHLTLNRTMRGSDHACSLEPDELSAMVRDIRIMERALGNETKCIRASERPFIKKLTKSICTQRTLHAGHIISRDDLIIKHPGTGISPLLMNQVIGKTVIRTIEFDHILQESDIV